MFNPVDTKLKAVAWIAVWKVLDTISTLLMTSKYGWSIEANPLVKGLMGYVSPELSVAALIPAVSTGIYLSYDRFIPITDSLAWSIPMITIGNFIQHFGFTVVGHYWNLAVIGLFLVYVARGELVFFDTSFEEEAKPLHRFWGDSEEDVEESPNPPEGDTSV